MLTHQGTGIAALLGRAVLRVVRAAAGEWRDGPAHPGTASAQQSRHCGQSKNHSHAEKPATLSDPSFTT
jgi:hypothetical protein